ncbi:MAG: 4-hydroxy-tetrahydrodipicolinate reductase [Gammaproteobacteria bacterium]
MSQVGSSRGDTIRIAIAGASGRMGRQLIAGVLAHDRYTLVGVSDRVESEFLGCDVGTLCGTPPQGVVVSDDLAQVLRSADVLIDFTRPEATVAHVAACVTHQVAAVIGTTGLSEADITTLKQCAERTPLVWAPNMSVGVNITFRLIELAAKALGEEYDIEIVEAHHRYKVDAPSGTALKMGEVAAIASGRDFKSAAVLSREGITGERRKGSIGFATVRGGDVAGEHSVLYLGEGEQIEITHKSRDRRHFVHGALRASAWVMNRKPGFYGMEHVLDMAH